MTADTVPYVSLALSNIEVGNPALTKSARKAFGNITDVESYYTSKTDCGIVVFCGYKNLKQDCYMDIFGG